MLSYLDELLLPVSVSQQEGVAPSSTRVPVVLVFCHGLLIKAVLRSILGASPRMTHKIEMGNTGVTEISYSTKKDDFGGWHVHRTNDISHLAHLVQ